jgi:nucleotide-binding universal stress UspA family protein
MFRKILLPLDGSEAAEQSLHWAKVYGKPSKAQVVLVQVLVTRYPLKGLPFRAGSAEARIYLQGIERELNFAGIPSKILLRGEPVTHAIVGTAHREGCDLIIMTSRGASKVVRWLIGGITQQVMRLSHIPILIVRSAIASKLHERPRRLLVPQDGSVHARKILPWAGRLSHLHKIPMVIVHVRTVHGDGTAPRILQRQAEALKRKGVHAVLRTEQGDPAEQILKACQPGDLLAMTTHGYGGFKRLILGSIAEKVIHQATVPVLVDEHRAKQRRMARDLEAVGLLES